MKKEAKDNRPNVKPVKSIELSEKNKTARIIVVVLLLAIGIGALSFALFSLLNKESGWREIEPASDNPNSQFFYLNYNIGASGAGASAEYKKISSLYDEKLKKYGALFSADTDSSEVKNLYYINRHIGEEITVEPALYNAFKLLADKGDRSVFLGPVSSFYSAMFSCTEDGYAKLFDPYKDASAAEFCAKIAAFAANPDKISLELLEGNKVRLNVSDDYKSFVTANGYDSFIDFGWLENAFVVDAVSDSLSASGYKYGILSSYDGFTRNLDSSEREYSFSAFDKYEGVVYPAAGISYKGGAAIVGYRAYPIAQVDGFNYYTYSDGASAHYYVDTNDARYKNSTDNITFVSNSSGCAALALSSCKIFIAEAFDSATVIELEASGVSAVYFDGLKAVASGNAIKITELYSDEKISYSSATGN